MDQSVYTVQIRTSDAQGFESQRRMQRLFRARKLRAFLGTKSNAKTPRPLPIMEGGKPTSLADNAESVKNVLNVLTPDCEGVRWYALCYELSYFSS